MKSLYRICRHLALIGATVVVSACGGSDDDPPPEPVGLSAPAAAASAVTSGGLVGVAFGMLDDSRTELGHAGRRKLAGAPLEGNEHFIIGSNTKAMTAALAARLVERGLLRWDTRIAEALPGITLHPAYREVTLEQLLAHRGGVLALAGSPDLERFEAHLLAFEGPLPATPAQRRRFFSEWALQQPPLPGVAPGQTFLYSNAGYAVVGAMLEAVSGQPWDRLFDEALARPLGISGSWVRPELLGPQQTVGHAGPRGSVEVVPPFEPDAQAWFDVIAPAGLYSTTPAAYAHWLRWHLRALRGESTPLPQGYVQRLKALRTTPDDYAVGWAAVQVDGRALFVHTGHWAGYSAEVAVAADGRRASFGLTNVGHFSEDGRSWVLETIDQLLAEMDREST